MVLKLLLVGFFAALYLTSCNEDENVLSNLSGNSNQSTTWLIPKSEVFDGGPGKDGIPALEDPEKTTASAANHLQDSELVLGYFDGENAVAYPHQVLDWHEIINDELNNFPFAITYCPLTGTGIGWARTFNGSTTTFGVSGLIYNNNLIPYDRQTGSNWSQIRLDCVNGTLIRRKIKTFQLVETSWQTWKEMYPSTEVVSLNTGFNRSYGLYPYGAYKTDENFLLFPLGIDDRRLNRKERVHGVIVDGVAKVYRFESFASANTLINDVINGAEVIIIGNEAKNFIVSFYAQLNDGTKPIYKAVNKNNIILEDNFGNEWDAFGYAVSGPSKGKRLRITESFIGYWFSWGVFYPGAEIHEL